MARRELGPAALAVAQAVTAALSDVVGPCVVGVSGGADSLALAAGVEWASRRLPVEPVCVVVDHGLQAGSADVARRAADQCRELGLPARVEEALFSTIPESNVEALAREARLCVLSGFPGPILLGHTRDDQAEQVLLGLARGSGPRSIAGMRPNSGRHLRPLLDLPRATTQQACAEWGLEPWSDPMNEDPSFLRVRARRLLPLLERELGAGFAEALARTARLTAMDVDHLDAQVPTVLPAELPVADLAALPPAIRTRWLRRWLLDHEAAPTFSDIARVDALVTDWHGQGPVQLAGLVVARRDGALVAWRP